MIFLSSQESPLFVGDGVEYTINYCILRDAVNIHVATTNVKLTLEGGRGSELSFFDVSPWQYEFFFLLIISLNFLLRSIVNRSKGHICGLCTT